MNDIKVLEDAFIELERRADEFAPRPEFSRRRRSRVVPVAAAILAAAALAIGVVVLGPGGDPGSAPTPNQVGTKPATPTAKLPIDSVVPDSAPELIDQFTRVLHGSAAFTVTDTGAGAETNGTPEVKMVGAAIVGILTKSGVKGGYDLGIYPADPDGKAWCDEAAHCKKSTLPDGSTLAVNTTTMPDIPGSLCYQADLVRKDGVEILMHACNTKDSKGQYGGPVFAPKPPLSTAELVAIVTSKKW